MERDIRDLLKLQGQRLSAAIAREQMLTRTLAAVLISREMDKAPDPEGARREIIEAWTRALDLYQIDRPTRPDLFQEDLEFARVTVDALATLVSALRPQPPRGN